MTKNIPERLEEINLNPELLATADATVKTLLQYAFAPAMKFNLPEGTPPYKPDAAPIGMTPGNMLGEVRRFYVFCRNDLSPIKRESLFVGLLESIHPSEAIVLLAVKEQALHLLYPNITAQAVFAAGITTTAPVVLDIPKVKVSTKKSLTVDGPVVSVLLKVKKVRKVGSSVSGE